MKTSRMIKLILLGACAPVVGVLFFFIQTRMNPDGLVLYNLVQMGMATLYILLFAVAGARLAKEEYTRWNKYLFFCIPILLLIADRTVLFNRPIPVGMLLLGINAPFFAFWVHVYAFMSPFSEVATALPTALCFLMFILGELKQRKGGSIK